jgi:hypothetical protein
MRPGIQAKENETEQEAQDRLAKIPLAEYENYLETESRKRGIPIEVLSERVKKIRDSKSEMERWEGYVEWCTRVDGKNNRIEVEKANFDYLKTKPEYVDQCLMAKSKSTGDRFDRERKPPIKNHQLEFLGDRHYYFVLGDNERCIDDKVFSTELRQSMDVDARNFARQAEAFGVRDRGNRERLEIMDQKKYSYRQADFELQTKQSSS